MAPKYAQIIKRLGKERVRVKEFLAPHTTFKIGGIADLFYEAKEEEEIVRAVKLARKLKIPYFILGGGSNLLISDEGFRGLVIKINNKKLEINNNGKIKVDAGVPLSKLVEEVKKKSLTGLEFAVGIPGTVGGAIWGNAGAFQQSIGELVSRLKILNEEGRIKWLRLKDCQFSYRQSRFKSSKEVILEVELKLKKGKRKEIEKKMAENLTKRLSQPKEPSAGCVFVNPKPLVAGKLIQECGLKGKRVGDAQISSLHGNFIVNLGKARASEVIKLIKLIKEKVKEKFGVILQEEIQLVGFDKNYFKE